jgi:probable rRNA maturation factor
MRLRIRKKNPMTPQQIRRPPIRISNDHPALKVRKNAIDKLVKHVLRVEKIPVREIHIIFVEDEYLRGLHKKYLNDDTPTDVMSFNLSDDDHIEGEIYISLDSAKSQAPRFDVSFDFEIARLIIHGLLHLKGYDDSTAPERKEMRAKEDYYLDKYLRMILL